jgi:hypothetical protein
MNRPTVPNRVWITALALWLLPGGIFLSLAYLFYQEVKFDEQASAWSKASLAEFKERRQKQKEAKNDVHSVGNE